MTDEKKVEGTATFEEIVTVLAASIIGKLELENLNEVLHQNVESFFVSMHLPADKEGEDGLIQFAAFPECGDDPHFQAIIKLVQTLAKKLNTDARSILDKIILAKV